jgi:hypothetical protein
MSPDWPAIASTLAEHRTLWAVAVGSLESLRPLALGAAPQQQQSKHDAQQRKLAQSLLGQVQQIGLGLAIACTAGRSTAPCPTNQLTACNMQVPCAALQQLADQRQAGRSLLAAGDQLSDMQGEFAVLQEAVHALQAQLDNLQAAIAAGGDAALVELAAPAPAQDDQQALLESLSQLELQPDNAVAGAQPATRMHDAEWLVLCEVLCSAYRRQLRMLVSKQE